MKTQHRPALIADQTQAPPVGDEADVTGVARHPDYSTSQATAAQAHRNRSCWPATRLASALFTLLLAVCLGMPPSLRSGSVELPILLLPTMLAAASARIAFETLDGSTSSLGVRGHVPSAVAGAVLGTATIAAASLILDVGDISAASLCGTTALAATTLLGAGLARDLEIRVRLSLRRVCFVGAPVSRQDLYHELARRRDAQLVATLTNAAAIEPAELVATVRESEATVLVLDRDALEIPRIVATARQLNLEGVQVRDLVAYYEREFRKVPLSELTPTWFLFDLAVIHENVLSRSLRRALELIVASLLLLAAGPILCIAWLGIVATSPGPGLYRQARIGRDGIPFTLVKLRTMRTADEPAAWAGTHAHRITTIGRFLRRFRLDELPQLWNVICGDLALVGPRPEQVPIVQDLERQIPFYAARHSVRPGLTGWAQVNLGYGGSLEGTLAKLQRDLYYIKHSSWRLDVLIIWLTVKAVITNPG